jgi:hypothetical protein
MSQNLLIQQGRHMDDHFIVVVDIQDPTGTGPRASPPWTTPTIPPLQQELQPQGGQMRYVTATTGTSSGAVKGCGVDQGRTVSPKKEPS